MSTFLHYIRTWFYQKFNFPIGIAIISCFFGIPSIIELIIALKSIGIFSGYSFLYLLIPVGTILTCIGLIIKKGWAWNFAVLINSYILIFGLLDALRQYFYTETAGDIKRLSFAIVLNVIIHGPIYYYLLHKDVKKLYPPSATSLFVIGLFLMSFMVVNYTDAIHGYFKILLFIIGLAILIKGKQIRNAEI
nr:hypothetical protein [uncultured Desulfobacter sp.]